MADAARAARLADRIKVIVAQALERRIKDPRVGFVTVTDARVTNDLTIFRAKSVPPQNTRARLRGEFIRRAQERRRDFTVDWVHLKLNDQAQRTVLCKDPFRAHDERVQRLIDGM